MAEKAILLKLTVNSKRRPAEAQQVFLGSWQADPKTYLDEEGSGSHQGNFERTVRGAPQWPREFCMLWTRPKKKKKKKKKTQRERQRERRARKGSLARYQMGVPTVAQQVMNPTSVHEDVGLILDVWGIRCGCDCGVGRQLLLHL